MNPATAAHLQFLSVLGDYGSKLVRYTDGGRSRVVSKKHRAKRKAQRQARRRQRQR